MESIGRCPLPVSIGDCYENNNNNKENLKVEILGVFKLRSFFGVLGTEKR
jgi:hypothetical protein